jgi:hypothetical protein
MLLAVVTLLALVLVPFLFWRGTWFGRPLTDREIDEYIKDEKKPRHVQHALVQISQRIERGDRSTQRWYFRITELAGSPVLELRITSAWVMGQDNTSEPFHATLRGMLQDREIIVWRNAALSLARFGDAAGRHELLAMLRPFILQSPAEGILRYRLQVGQSADRGTLLARAGENEIRSPLPGKLQRKVAVDGAHVKPGDEILWLVPNPDHVWEALRALYLIGTSEDLPDVEKYLNPPAQWPARIAEQAKLTASQIRKRAGA